jgi:predicted amidohydrolase YtcJ
MLTPYADDPSTSGKLFWDPAKYKSAVLQLNQRGFQVFTHSIGTLAVRTALDAFAASQSAGTDRDLRDRVEHIETISPQDIPRFGQLNVIASMQPLHTEPNDDTLKIWARNAGPERVAHAWPWREILDTHGRLAFGSDWPVVTLSPWPGVLTALTRQTSAGAPPGGWVPQERISLPETIKAYTLDAAYAGHRERTEGSLEPGKLADFIVLDRDLFRIPASQAADEKVLLTVIGGNTVYQSPQFAPAAVKGTGR